MYTVQSLQYVTKYEAQMEFNKKVKVSQAHL